MIVEVFALYRYDEQSTYFSFKVVMDSSPRLPIMVRMSVLRLEACFWRRIKCMVAIIIIMSTHPKIITTAKDER